MAKNAKPLFVYMIAGEPSGDALGGRLMSALIDETNGAIKFAGVGGADMINQGMDSLFPMSELSVMGIAEIVPKIPNLLRRMSEVVSDVNRLKPDAVITIDAPDFSFRVAKRLKSADFPLIHLVAPTVWAWRPGRAAKVAQFLDHLLCLFPFEPQYFEKEGLAATFVGHSLIESAACRADGRAFRQRHKIPADISLLAVLPGSRMGEITRHLPVFRDTVERLGQRLANLQIVAVTTGQVANRVRSEISDWPLPTHIIDRNDEKYDAMAAADVALAASGTVALELAVVGTPSVIGYRVNPLTAMIGKWLVTARFASLVNILLEKPVMPEFLVDRCRADILVPELLQLFNQPDARRAQTDAFKRAVSLLSPGPDLSPSQKAAQSILRTIATYK